MNIGDRIAKLRKDNGLSQKEFALKIGSSTGVVAEWESGEISPSIADIAQISSVFSISTDSLIMESELSVSATTKEKVIIYSNEHNRRKHPKKKTVVAIVAGILVFLCVIGAAGYFFLIPKINATKAFYAARASLEEKNIELDVAVIDVENLIKQPCLDKALPLKMDTLIKEAKSGKYEAPEIPKSVDQIALITKEMLEVDYTSVLAKISEESEEYKVSVQRFELVDCPTEEYIIDCLIKLPYFVDYAVATEDNDPNGNLHKPGGYTSQVYFESELVDLWWCEEDPLIDKGTDAGGSVEVYTTVSDAEKRNEYLSMYDGTALSSGSHTVVGTCVVRTSCELNATQQRNYEADIVALLTALPGEEILFLSKPSPIIAPEVEQEAEPPTEPTTESPQNPSEDSSQNPETEPPTEPSTEPNESENTYYSAAGTYSNGKSTLYIYSTGSLYWESYNNSDDDPNNDYWPVYGSWSQIGNTLCYNVWDEGGDWNNPFYDTVYADGIDFLGEYYWRTN